MILCREQKADKFGYETSALGKHGRGNQILKTTAGIVGRTLDGVETSAVWKLSEFRMSMLPKVCAPKCASCVHRCSFAASFGMLSWAHGTIRTEVSHGL